MAANNVLEMESGSSKAPRPTFLGQMGTMIRRNLLIKWKSKGSTIAEIGIPAFFIGVFVIVSNLQDHTPLTPEPAIPEFQDQPFELTYRHFDTYRIAFAPNTSQTIEFMDSVRELLLFKGRILEPKPYATAAEISSVYEIETDSELLPFDAGIIFNNAQLDTLDFTLRMMPENVPNVRRPYLSTWNQCRQPRPNAMNPDSNTTTSPETPVPVVGCYPSSYATGGFSMLQTALTTAYMKRKTDPFNNLAFPNLVAKLFPMPEERPFLTFHAMGRTAAVGQILIIFSIFSYFLVNLVVTEKEKKHIESMKIMGLRSSVYWISWLLWYVLLMLIISCLFVGICKAFAIWRHSDAFLLIIASMLTAGSMISIALCLAPFFRKPVIAGMVAFVLEVILSNIAMLEVIVPELPESAKWALSLLPPSAFYMAIFRVSKAEAYNEGLGWTNAASDSGFNYAAALGMLALDFVLYSLLAVYLSKIVPYDDSPRERPWFFLLPSYWCPKRSDSNLPPVNMDDLFQSGDIEPVPEAVRTRTAVTINKLKKVFPGMIKTTAVDDFTYEVYQDEILAVLGHNGAGKTTLISMLTGILHPTSGTAIIYGHDIANSSDLEEIRTTLGYCPQHNVLFEDFTVKEQLIFFSRLKGYSSREAELECDRLLQETGMHEQQNVFAKNLSGGQKRRLSIAIAVIGNPKLLILDEPSSGVDVYSQRFLWDMIRGFKRNRCVIIATQSMQEADVLADRKLIMSHGKLRCAGSSLFLKNRFGLGYYLTMAVQKDCNAVQVDEIVSRIIAGAERTRSHAGELSFVLPKEQTARYPELFNQLDQNKSKLLIDSYGVSVTTMEEIFLRLAEEDKDAQTELKTLGKKTILERKRSAETTEPANSDRSNSRQFLALVKIRLLLMIRSKLAIFFIIIFPILSMATLGGLTEVVRSFASEPNAEGNELRASLEDIKNDFRAVGSRWFIENLSGAPVEGLTQRLVQDGLPLDFESYFNVLKTAPHHGGYILKNLSVLELSAAIGYNSTATHSIPYLTNALLNAFFNSITGSTETFRFVNQPFPYRNFFDSPGFAPAQMNGMIIVLLIGMALALIPGTFGLDVSRDRIWNTRSQIRMTGCSFWLYWTTAFLTHILQFFVAFVIVMIFCYGFSMEPVTDVMGYFVLLFLIYSMASILFCYCLSFLFAKISTATSGLVGPFMLISYLMYLLVFFLNALGKEDAAEALHYVFAVMFPGYGLFGGLNALLEAGAKKETNYFNWDTRFPFPPILLANAVHIPLLLLVLVILESRFFNQHWLQVFGVHPSANMSRPKEESATAQDDNDVFRERQVVSSVDPVTDKTFALVLRALWKKFPANPGLFAVCGVRRTKVAVKNLSIGFPKGEIFGLLGPNGAGKTTALSMVTGELTPNHGDVHVNGHNMTTETDRALEAMGSCPQTDTLWEDITMKEHLEFFAVMNGLPKHKIQETVRRFTEGLRITEHMKKRSSALSGGTKRKLTFVVSMIGNPPLVMLDEPSTGMDPQSKRYVWDMIMSSFTGERGAVLTTHSMEEADALCDRIGIIVKGELQCIGSSQHLKNKFGSGYHLEVKLSIPEEASSNDRQIMVEHTKASVSKLLERSLCVEEMHNRLVFAVPQEACPSLGTVFSELERLKTEENLEEYSFSQSTIEQVFLHFARMQDVQDGILTPTADTVVPVIQSP